VSLETTVSVRPEPDEGQGSGEVLDALACLESLLDKNLITRIEVNGEQRFSMLETIREYALEQLTASGEADTIRQRHAHFILALVEEALPKWWTIEQTVWSKRLEMELDNLRAALAWSIDNMIELGLQLADALKYFWIDGGYHSEGCDWFTKVLAKSQIDGIDIAGFRAKVLSGAGTLAWFQGDFTTAYTLEAESIVLARQAGDNTCLARALLWLGISVESQGDHARARSLLEESIALCRQIHNTRLLIEALYWHGYVTFEERDYEQARSSAEECIHLAQETGNIHFLAAGFLNLGHIAVDQGDYAKAQSFYEKSLKLHQKIKNKTSISRDLNRLGAALCAQGNYERARICYKRGLKIFQECGDNPCVAWSLQGLGEIALHQQRWHEAHTCFVESLVLSRKQGDTRIIARSLMGLAGVAEGQNQPERAAQLLGAIATLLEITGTSHWRVPIFRTDYERITAAVRNALGEETFAAEVAKGREMTLEEAMIMS
jgi:tetratricopeptide (TPR) repeat protein